MNPIPPSGPQPHSGASTGPALSPAMPPSGELKQELDKSYEAINHHLQFLVDTKKHLDSRLSTIQLDPSASDPSSEGVLTKYPAITVSTIVGLILATITLFGLPELSENQITALSVLVSALIGIVPIIGGFVIKTINTRKT